MRRRLLAWWLKRYFRDEPPWSSLSNQCRFGILEHPGYIVHVGGRTQKTCLLHLPCELRLAHEENPGAMIWVTKP